MAGELRCGKQMGDHYTRHSKKIIMADTRNEERTLDYPVDPRRHPGSGLGGVKLVTAHHSRMMETGRLVQNIPAQNPNTKA